MNLREQLAKEIEERCFGVSQFSWALTKSGMVCYQGHAYGWTWVLLEDHTYIYVWPMPEIDDKLEDMPFIPHHLGEDNWI